MFAAAVCAKRFLRGSLPWRDEGPRITAGCLRRQREQLEFLERQIEELDIRMQDPIRSDQPAVDLCVAIAGIEKVAAANWIAEIWIDEFIPLGPASGQLVRPVSREQRECRQAIERKARHGNVWLRRSLCQAAWVASHTKSTYFVGTVAPPSRPQRKQACHVAVAHTILVVVFHMFKSQQPYRDLGADYFDRQTPSN